MALAWFLSLQADSAAVLTALLATPAGMPGAVGPAVHRDEPVVVPGLGSSKLPWLVLGAGAFLAVAGLVALAVAFLRG